MGAPINATLPNPSYVHQNGRCRTTAGDKPAAEALSGLRAPSSMQVRGHHCGHQPAHALHLVAGTCAAADVFAIIAVANGGVVPGVEAWGDVVFQKA
jgi:hypothetical protein